MTSKAVKETLEWYRDEALSLSINLAQKKTSAAMASVQVLSLDAGNRAVTALCDPVLNSEEVRILELALNNAYKLLDETAGREFLTQIEIVKIRKIVPKRFKNSFEYKG